ncbi:hypothetical protein [Glycomyces salinus]|uniref:hypothetical protein n=1 Tax=Glycomyces salinus TaxID=980294 RepID=UPI0018EAAC8A|nr:hypothetical protein [Glycomyces salinus]
MRKISRLLALLAAAVLILSSQTLATGDSAAADESVDAAGWYDVGPVSMGTSMTCMGERQSVGDAWVTLHGDYVTVRDFCADGLWVMARVSTVVNGEVKYWYCHNFDGGGSVKVCNFNWPERSQTKTLVFYAQDGNRSYRMGTIKHWRDG